jgi:3-deoxy-D-manno-octulosonic-acid transferase
MRWLVDKVYLLVAFLTAPIWLFRMIRTGKIRTDWAGRFGRAPAPPPRTGTAASCRRGGDGPRVLIHAVSVGEVNAVRRLAAELASGPDACQVVVATTTNTGFARARDALGGSHHVVRYPFDFSFAVSRFLDTVAPDVICLVELEVWPNFVAGAWRRGIPVCVVNGRLTARSFRRYRWLKPLIRPTFARLDAVAAQNEAYAERFRSLGTPAEGISVTGTMKWDTAEIADGVDGAEVLADAMGIERGRPLVVAGSTAPGEHELLDACVPEGVQLLCAPRKPEWFDQAAEALPRCARRSRGDRGSQTGRFLLDTIGELRQAYALADVVVVGRSFGSLHGSDMMEPVALGKATIVGPAVDDFADTVEALLEGGGIVQSDTDNLAIDLRELLDDPERRRALAEAGRAVIRARQGATARHAELIRNILANVAR